MLELANGTANATTGTFTLNGSAGIDFNNNTSLTTLTFADSSAVSWTGTLVIYGWNGTFGVGGGDSRLFFGNTASGLTAAQLSLITFDGFSGAVATILSTGEVVPIPEPGVVVLLATLGLGTVLNRRHIC
jgi:hypothetical protein